MQASRWSRLVRTGLALAVVAGCAGRTEQAPVPAGPPRPAVLLVSLDGFRWDYLDRGLTPNLERLAREGVRAEAMVPVFPTKTFPNHYSIVTGRYPAKHGIVGNVFTAPDLNDRLTLWNRDAVSDGRFYLAEPIWVTAERQGRRTAPLFWPGSDAKINGVRPTFRRPFDGELPDRERVDQLIEWLDQPPAKRPVFLTLYFSIVDNAGHDFGPDAPETDLAIARADSLIGYLVAELDQAGAADSMNLVIVSDHGMIGTSPERVIWVDEYLAEDAMTPDEMSTLLTAWPAPGLEDSVIRALRRAPHIAVYRREELPARFRLEGSPRVAPVMAIADAGWMIAQRTREEPSPEIILGNHGYDDTLPDMRAIFVAHGPAFKRGVTVPRFRNIHVYPLLAELLGVTPEPSEGSLDSVRAGLAD